MRSRSVSITGATGFLGWHLAEAFRDAGWVARAIVRPGNTKPLPQGVDSIEAALGPGQERLDGERAEQGPRVGNGHEGREGADGQERDKGEDRGALARAVEGSEVLVHAAGLTR